MALERTNDNGIIKINTAIFTKLILKSVSKMRNKAFLASEKGKLLGGLDKKISHSELLSHINLKNEEETYCIEFYIITEFGTSIKEITGGILDYLEEELKIMFPKNNLRLTLKVVGVKSKKIAERDITFNRYYEAK